MEPLSAIGAVPSLGQLVAMAQPSSTASAGSTGGTQGGGTPGAASSPAPSSSGSLLQPNEFLSLLVDSLKYQDPLSPTSTSNFLTQLAALSQVQIQTQISTTDQTAAATALLGQRVSGSDLAGNALSGIVSGVALTSSGPVLQVGADSMDLAALTAVGAAVSGSGGSSASPGAGASAATAAASSAAPSAGTAAAAAPSAGTAQSGTAPTGPTTPAGG